MARTTSNMLDLGTSAPAFSLPDTDGNTVSLADVSSPSPLLVAFICNHCPYVIHLKEALTAFGAEYMARGLSMVAISSNDIENYPQDSPDKMAEDKVAFGYPFPYLYDETQEVAKAYRAACTPDFFLFDEKGRLAYRGQFDDSRPGSEVEITGRDLRAAADAVLSGHSPTEDQRASLGCNIKWKPGRAP